MANNIYLKDKELRITITPLSVTPALLYFDSVRVINNTNFDTNYSLSTESRELMFTLLEDAEPINIVFAAFGR